MDNKNAATKFTGGNILIRSFSQTPKGLPSSELIYLNTTSRETTAKIDFTRPSIVTLKVFGAAGRLIYEESGDYEKGFIRKIDLRELSNGLNQVQINFQTITKRLIKLN